MVFIFLVCVKQLAQTEKQIHFFLLKSRNYRTTAKKIIDWFKSSWNRAVCFIDFNIFPHITWVKMSCYRFPKYSFETKVLFVFIVSYTNAKYSWIRHVFVYWDFLLIHTSIAMQLEQGRKKFYKQKQCIENGSLWRAFNGFIFIVFTFADSYDLDLHTSMHEMHSIQMVEFFFFHHPSSKSHKTRQWL